MLNLFAALSVLPLLIWGYAPSHGWVWASLSLLVQGLFIYGNVIPNSRWFGPVVTRFSTEHKEVWLTIDDGPDADETPKTLELLKQFGAKATFFVIGTRVLANPELIRRIVEDGHELGNHSATHPTSTFWCLSQRAATHEIRGGDAPIQDVTGLVPKYFRAPVGMANFLVHKAVKGQGKLLIGWSASGHDSVARCADAVLNKILARTRPGAIVLLHEAHVRAGGQQNRHDVLKTVLTRLREQGYAFVIPTEDQF